MLEFPIPGGAQGTMGHGALCSRLGDKVGVGHSMGWELFSNVIDSVTVWK